ncbi:MAG: hypothetical protein RIT26_2104 [Pseudomonadota bacterium]|jgi:uncharacterized membrane protein YhaH (DUF805 family)
MRFLNHLFLRGERADRSEFAWMGISLCLYAWLMFRASPYWVGIGPEEIEEELEWGPLVALGLVLLGWAWRVMMRRLHDLGRSGWTLLWALTLIAALPLWHTLSFKAGTPGPNRYGQPRAARRLEKFWLFAHGLSGLALMFAVVAHLSLLAYQAIHWHAAGARLNPTAPAMEVVEFHSSQRLYVAQIVCRNHELQLDVLGYQRPVRPFARWPALQGGLAPLKAHIKSGVENLPTQWEASSSPWSHGQSFDFLSSLKPEKLYGNQIVLTWSENEAEHQIHLYLTQPDLIEFMQACR